MPRNRLRKIGSRKQGLTLWLEDRSLCLDSGQDVQDYRSLGLWEAAGREYDISRWRLSKNMSPRRPLEGSVDLVQIFGEKLDTRMRGLLYRTPTGLEVAVGLAAHA